MATSNLSNDIKVSKRLFSFPKATAKTQIEKKDWPNSKVKSHFHSYLLCILKRILHLKE